MIKIRLKNEMHYKKLRQEYLERIAHYVEFDREDILNLDRKNSAASASVKTGELLKEKYPRLYNFLYMNPLYQVNRKNLRRLLAGPEQMPKSMGGTGKYEWMRDCFEEISSACGIPNQDEANVCRQIFRYEKGFGKSKADPYWLLREIGVHVCPYCNRLYTVTLLPMDEIEQQGEFKPTRPALDHFFPKSKYPYLAVSLFNLIPSCDVCNRNKGSKDTPILYPYDEEFGRETAFRVIPDFAARSEEDGENLLDFLHGGSDRFYIRFMSQCGISLLADAPLKYRLLDMNDKNHKDRTINEIELLHLEEIYNEHKKEARDILKKNYYFNDAYIETAIVPLLKQKMRTAELNQTENSWKQIAKELLFLGRTSAQFCDERPLSKMTEDILEQVSGESR